MKKPTLYIIIPCYNEEKVLPITCEMFLDKITELIQNDKIDDSSKIMFVNDGSKDKTWEIISDLAKKINIISELAEAEIEGIRMQFWQD